MQLLLSIIQTHADTEYGCHHNFDKIESIEDFLHQQPLTDYSHYEEYIIRTGQGEPNVMLPRPVVYMASSSGTSGNPKTLPIPDGYQKSYLSNAGFMINMLTKNRESLKRMIIIRIKPKLQRSPGGIPVGPISDLITPMPLHALTPKAVSRIDDEQVQMYVIALFSMAERDVDLLDGMVAPLCYAFFKRIEMDGKQMCDDLERGQLCDTLSMDPEIKAEISHHLNADPERSNEIRSALRAGKVGLAKRLWPHLAMASMASTGGFAPHAQLLRDTFLKGVFCKGFGHAASEGMIGMVTDPDHSPAVIQEQKYAFCITGTFFEFIPEEQIDMQTPKTLLIDQVSHVTISPSQPDDIYIANSLDLHYSWMHLLKD